MFSLMLASVQEEIGFRLFMLGIPLLVIDLLAGKGAPITRYFLGGRRIDSRAIFFIGLSSSMFAMAHLPSWDLWKLPPTLLVGGLEYLYLKEGILASGLIHFSFNLGHTLLFVLIDKSMIQTSLSS